MFQCAACGAQIQDRVTRRSTCPSCRADLHSCLNCRHYSRGRHNDCAEPQAELVKDRKRANFCDFFQMRKGPHGSRGPAASGSSTPGSGASGDESARDKFDKLFGG
jgi:hypothetical protein